MAAANLSSRQLARQLTLLERFKVRELRAQDTNNFQENSRNPHAFQPYKNPHTGRWYPPRLSLRRQAQLGKEAYRTGKFEELMSAVGEDNAMQSVKLSKMKSRIEELKIMQGQSESSPTSPTAAIVADSTAKVSKEQANKRAIRLAKALAATRGPYAGRSEKTLFKGTKAERDAPGRRRETAQKLAAMNDSIASWRKTISENRNRTRQILPFK